MEIQARQGRYNFSVTVRVLLFGGVRIESANGQTERLPTQKAAQLLGFLCIPPRRTHSREVLATLLWPDATPEAARHNLRQALSWLKKALGEDALVLEGRERIGLATIVVTDLNAFQEACHAGDTEAARSVNAGALFDGIYEDWALKERERCEALLAALPAERRVLLPAPLTRFFGREPEREWLAEELAAPGVRLVTLTGPGGLGKTRLSLEAARQAQFPLVVFVPLADATIPARTLESIAEGLGRTLGVSPTLHTTALERISQWLGTTPALLVLDNFEQLAEPPGVHAIRQILERCPKTKILLTSRRALGLSGERELPLAPLPTPEHGGTPERLLEFPSVQLFLDRARAVRSTFRITSENAATVGSLCARLEGIPLALELAASRARALTPAQILTHLSDRFAFLTSKDTTIPERQRTLWAAIEGSVALLDSDSREAFLKLGVYRGGWTLQSGEAVGATLDGLERLLQAAIIESQEQSDSLRFSMRETLREYALSTLTEADKSFALEQHASWFLKLALQESERLQGPEQARALELLDRELPNLRRARETLRECEDKASLEQLGAALALYLFRRTHLEEGRDWLTEALELGNGEPLSVAKLCDALGAICAAQGDFPAAEDYLLRGLTLRQQLGDRMAQVRSLANLGTLTLDRGDAQGAQARLTEALALAADTAPVLVQAVILGNLGVATMQLKQWSQAEQYFIRGLRLRQELGDESGQAIARLNLGAVALSLGRPEESEIFYQEALHQFHTLGDRRNRAQAAEGLSEALATQGAFESAARWQGAAQAEQDAIGALRTADNTASFAACATTLKKRLGERGYRRCFTEGEVQGLSVLLKHNLLTFS